MKKWEYLTVKCPRLKKDIDQVLKQNGEYGWELVWMAGDVFIFKREKIEKQEPVEGD